MHMQTCWRFHEHRSLADLLPAVVIAPPEAHSPKACINFLMNLHLPFAPTCFLIRLTSSAAAQNTWARSAGEGNHLELVCDA